MGITVFTAIPIHQLISPPSICISSRKDTPLIPMLLSRNQRNLHLGIIICLTLITRLAYLCSPAGQIGDADEAVFGLMAIKIAAFEEFPIYCWGAQYAGAVISYAAAPLLAIFGPSFTLLRLPMLPIAVLTASIYYLFLERLAGSIAALAGSLFFVFAPIVVIRHTMAAYGGYGETLLGFALILLLGRTVEPTSENGHTHAWPMLLGLVCGFFFYILFLMLPAILAFALSPLLSISKARRRHLVRFSAGALLGISPLIIHNIRETGGTILRAAGRSLSVDRADLHAPHSELAWRVILQKATFCYEWIRSAPRLFGEYVVSGVASDTVVETAGTILIAVLLVFAVRAFACRRQFGQEFLQYRRFALFLALLIGFQWVANLNRARHLLPLLLVIPVAALALTQPHTVRRRLVVIGLVVLALAQIPGWALGFHEQAFNPYPLAGYLRDIGVRTFFGSYYTTYPVTFVTMERIVGAPLLPSNEGIVVDRRPQYTRRVIDSPSPAFVFTRNEKYSEERFRAFLRLNNISFRSLTVESAVVYSDFSQRVSMSNSPDGFQFAVRQ
jgi:hypothetical protein